MPLKGLIECQFLSVAADGQAISNTFHVTNASTGSAPDLSELAGVAVDLKAWCATQYEAMLQPDSTFQYINTKQVRDPQVSPPELVQIHNEYLGVPGTGTPGPSQHMPQEMCAIIRKSTSTASRRFRGHMFMPPGKDGTQVNNESWSQTGQYWLACDAFRAKLSAGVRNAASPWTGSHLASYVICVYSRRAAQLGQPSVGELSGLQTQLKIHWLRSRKRGTS